MEKALQRARADKDQLLEQKNHEAEQLRESLKLELVDVEQRAREQQERNQQVTETRKLVVGMKFDCNKSGNNKLSQLVI